ncbi:MAG: dTMP kinase [Peptoniphilus sp.]|uniref:dTMP kinase n=1 Tax=Peptoniphilus sp. TaxID=1971214 RepID=UPI002A7476F7|nr:dTMP kinase [Peptoniphilus sp.]MDY2986763.1 dTMP kinase [Peptoniphilus sp.]
MRGLFIAFEGPDGCGKTTIANKVYEELSRKFNCLKTREPGGTEISEKIRDFILDNNNVEMTSRTEALLYAASRAQHVEQLIEPALKMGKIVICERFIVSSLVYQGYARGLGERQVQEINDFAVGEVSPDITFLFDVKKNNSVERKLKVGGDRLELEKGEFHSKVREGYESLIKSGRYTVIDATQSVEEVFKNCMDVILERLDRK